MVSSLKRPERPPAARRRSGAGAVIGGRRGRIRQQAELYFLLCLPLLFFAIFRYLPMVGLLMAFQDFNVFKGFLHSRWVGLKIFRSIFAMGDFWKALRNTLMLNGLNLLIGFPAPIILALLLNEVSHQGLKRLFQSTLYLPYFLSWVIIGSMALKLFADHTGLINAMVVRAGGSPIPFLSEKWHWVMTYQLISIWQSAGWGTIICLSAIADIGPELYEAAEVDGAGRLQKARFVTIPGISTTMLILFILQVGRIASIGFEQPFVLGNRIVSDFSEVISTFVYHVGLEAGRFDTGTAVGLFQSVVGLGFLLGANALSRKATDTGIW